MTAISAVDSRDVIPFTADLVRHPSVLGNEEDVANAVVARMSDLGYDEAGIDAAGNAVGVIRGTRTGPTLVFDGHMDTVDVEPIDAWMHDPFGAEIVHGKMYGRGTSDMKGAVAAMVYGVAGIDRDRVHGTVVVSASVGEELVEGPALRYVLESHPADVVVIGEASELDVIFGGRGRAEFKLTTHGKPSHASTPQLGENAVHKMFDVIRAIEGLSVPQSSVVGPGVMALTDIISIPYPAHSVIPSGCRATYERRLVPGEIMDELMEELQRACTEAGASDTTIELATSDYRSYSGLNWSQPKWFPAWVMEENDPIVQTARDALRAIGQTPKIRAYQFCTNAAYSAGEAGIPTIGLGPSSESLAHVTDEYIEIEELLRAVDAYRAVAEALLSESR